MYVVWGLEYQNAGWQCWLREQHTQTHSHKHTNTHTHTHTHPHTHTNTHTHTHTYTQVLVGSPVCKRETQANECAPTLKAESLRVQDIRSPAIHSQDIRSEEIRSESIRSSEIAIFSWGMRTPHIFFFSCSSCDMFFVCPHSAIYVRPFAQIIRFFFFTRFAGNASL
jgi:hypothetical protein